MGAFDYQQQRKQAKAGREAADAGQDAVQLLSQLVWEQQQTNVMLNALVQKLLGP